MQFTILQITLDVNRKQSTKTSSGVIAELLVYFLLCICNIKCEFIQRIVVAKASLMH